MKVYVSYAPDTKDYFERLRNFLNTQGIDIYSDDNIDSALNYEKLKVIENCDEFIFLFSNGAEINGDSLGMALGSKTIFWLLTDEAQFPKNAQDAVNFRSLTKYFNPEKHKRINWYGNRSDDEVFKELLDALHSDYHEEPKCDNSPEDVTKVFISYSSSNLEFADKAASFLRDKGINTWRDKESITAGKQFYIEIPKGIKNCKVVLCLFSKEADKSPNVAVELSIAFANGKKIIPLPVDESNPEKLYYFLITHQYPVRWLEINKNDALEKIVVDIRELLKNDNDSQPVIPPGLKKIKDNEENEQEKHGKYFSRHKKFWSFTALIFALIAFISAVSYAYWPLVKASRGNLAKLLHMAQFFTISDGWDEFKLAEHGTPEYILDAVNTGADFNIISGDDEGENASLFNSPLLKALAVNPNHEALITILESLPDSHDIISGRKNFLYNYHDYPRFYYKSSLLGLAAIYGTRGLVSRLIDEGFDVDYSDENGITILMLAAANADDTEIVKLIAQLCNNINARDKVYGRTALMIASAGLRLETVRTLQGAGADLNIQDNWGRTALMIALSCEDTKSPDTKELIEKIAASLIKADVNIKDKWGRYAADYAKENELFAKDFQYIKDLSPTQIELSDVFGLARYGTAKQIQDSINAGFSFNVSKDKGLTPLHDAAANNLYEKSIELILSQGINVNSSASGYTPIMYAARSNPNLKVIKILLKHGADSAVRVKAYYGVDEALSLAVEHNKPEIVKAIFNAQSHERQRDILNGKINYGHAGAITSGSARYYETLLGLAAQVNNIDAVKFLLDSGADVNAQSVNGRTALMSAAEFSSMQIFKLLLDSGADVNIQDNFSGTTALIETIKSHHNWEPDYLIYEKTELLLKAGADTNIQDQNGTTALLELCNSLGNILEMRRALFNMDTWTVENEPELFKMLIDYGADVNIERNEDKLTPLIIAVKELTHYETFAVTETNSNGELYIKNYRETYRETLPDGAEKIINTLLDSGADVNVRDQDGRYPDYFISKNDPVYARIQHDEEAAGYIELAVHAEENGFKAVDRGDLEGAEANFTKALDLRKKIAAKTRTLQAELNTAKVYSYLAKVLLMKKGSRYSIEVNSEDIK